MLTTQETNITAIVVGGFGGVGLRDPPCKAKPSFNSVLILYREVRDATMGFHLRLHGVDPLQDNDLEGIAE